MELVEVCRDSQTKAVVNLHGEISVSLVLIQPFNCLHVGATLQSWINNGEEMIFVR